MTALPQMPQVWKWLPSFLKKYQGVIFNEKDHGTLRGGDIDGRHVRHSLCRALADGKYMRNPAAVHWRAGNRLFAAAVIAKAGKMPAGLHTDSAGLSRNPF